MTTSLLAYIPSPAQGVWHLGPVPIRAYALCIITGIIAALVIGDRRWVARGGEPGVIYDIALWTVPFGLIGGRLYHLMTDWRTYFAEGGAGIGAAVRIWDGGLGIWGAVALGGVGAWIGCRRHGIPLPAFGDAIAPGIILAQAIGRLGNYFNQELYGRPTDLPWGLEIFQRTDGSGVVNPHLLNGVSTGQVYEIVHPTFLYELLWNLLVFGLLLWADRRFKLGHGRLFALYVAAYCVGRFGVELMRSDTATLIAGIRVNSFTSTFVFIGAVVYMMVAPRGREDPATLGGRQAEEAAAEEAEVEPEVDAEGAAALAVPVAVAAGVAAGGTAEADDGADGADLAEPVAESDVADEAEAVETQPDETEALAEQAVDAEAAEAEAAEGVAESEGTAESDETADEAVAETDVVDADDVADVVDAAEDEAVEESEEPTDSDDSAAESATAEEAAPKTEATTKVEPVGVPVWEPPVPRRRWWRRQG